MKNKFSKILSSLLILSFLMSALSVFSFAESTGTAAQESDSSESYELFINRNYEEGWGYSNAMLIDSYGGHNVFIDYEEDEIYNYNYFARFETSGSGLCFTRYDLSRDAILPGESAKPLIVEFSVKADDVATLGSIVSGTTQQNAEEFRILYLNENGELIAFSQSSEYVDDDNNPNNDPNVNLGVLGDEWVNIGLIFDWSEKQRVNCQLYYGTGDGYQYNREVSFALTKPDGGGIRYINFVIPKYASRPGSSTLAPEYYDGMSWCLDNLKIYIGSSTFRTFEEGNYGTKIDTGEEKVVDVKKNAQDLSLSQIIAKALAMKVGVDSALIKDEKYSLSNNDSQTSYTGNYGTPVIDADGNVMIPLELVLDYIGLPFYLHADQKSFDITTENSVTCVTIGNDSAVVDGTIIDLTTKPKLVTGASGKEYIGVALADVEALFPGWLTIYDDMGFILIYEDMTPENLEDNEPILTRESNLGTMVDVMKKFVFDTVDMESEEDAYVATGEAVYESAKKNTAEFSHPYIIADANTFKALKDAYALTEGQAGYDATLNAYIQAVLSEAKAYYEENANVSGGAYVGIKEDKIPINANYDDSGDGYDIAYGRLDAIVEYTEILPVIALAYQITGDESYAKFAYDWSVALSEWVHWGPGYFESCALATASYALAYDWLYNAYKALGKDTDVLAEAIYNLGVHEGYLSSSGQECEHPRSLGDMSGYTDAENDLNAIGSYGMIVGSLAILDYVEEDALDEAIYLIGNNLKNLIANGLDIYAPAGAYDLTVEQWEKGTSSFFRMVMALVSSTGSDYGLMQASGIEETCYYAIHIESSDGFIWNYNDANGDGVTSSESLKTLNTDMFYFVGSFYDDENLIGIRAKQIKDGKSATIFDLLSYPFGETIEEPNIDTDYYFQGIEAYVYRSDWNKGALYTGIMGGKNSGDSAQVDSGNFIYHNKGIVWFMDLGGEDSRVYGYDDPEYRYKYYRVNAEGQNVVYMVGEDSLPYGQLESAEGTIMKTYENEHGSYAIIDNTSVFDGHVSNAFRGLLITNDGKTVVLQDEISVVSTKTFCWTVHTAQKIYIDTETGRTAYLVGTDSDGNIYTLRATIVTPTKDLKFETLTRSTKLLDHDSPANNGDVKEYSRNGIERLAIISDDGEFGVGTFNVAVVFEMVEDQFDTSPVAYDFTWMSQWMPETYVEKVDDGSGEQRRGAANVVNVRTSTAIAENILEKEDAFSTKLKELYEALTLVEYTLLTYPPQTLEPMYEQHYSNYLTFVNEYTAYMDYANENVELIGGLVSRLAGITTETEAE